MPDPGAIQGPRPSQDCAAGAEKTCMSSLSSDSCAAWTRRLTSAPIPVLRVTANTVDALSEHHEAVGANSLADFILRDPLMTLRLLIHISRTVGSRLVTPVETVTGGLVLTGIDPFFRDFSSLPRLEDRLAPVPAALAGALRAIERSRRAARLAAAFAIHRQDEDAEVLHQAALLNNFAGLLIWCEAPALALEMAARQRADRALRSAEVQRAVLGVELAALELALMEAWGLSPFLRELATPGDAPRAGPRSVMLAVRIARHSHAGWNNPALPDDYFELGQLLNMPVHAACALVREVDL